MGPSSNSLENTRNTILSRLYNSDNLKRIIQRATQPELHEDFKQELFLVLLQQDAKKIIDIETQGQLMNFTARIVFNMVSKKGRFKYKYEQKNISGYAQFIENEMKTGVPADVIKKAIAKLNSMNGGDEIQMQKFFLFTQYIEFRSCNGVSDFYGIDERYVRRIISEVKNEFRKFIRNSC